MYVVETPYICRKKGNLKVCLKHKIKVWEEYMKIILNTENDVAGKVEGPCDIVFETDVENTLHRMKTLKAAGPSEITADLL